MEFAFISPTEKPREACFDPGNIMNGTRIGTDFKLGSTVTYQCDSGYKIADPSSITCVIGVDGKPAWDRVLPSCNGTCWRVGPELPSEIASLWNSDPHSGEGPHISPLPHQWGDPTEQRGISIWPALSVSFNLLRFLGGGYFSFT